MLCDLSDYASIECVEKYLEHQPFKNYQFIVLPEGYNSACAGQRKNLLLWQMTGNLFVFASSIDQKNNSFLSNIVSQFYINRDLALVVDLDKAFSLKGYSNEFLSRQFVLDFMEAAIQVEGTLNPQNFRVLSGYKSVIKPAGWYKKQLGFYEDLNLVYRVLIKTNVRIDGRAVELSNTSKQSCKQELTQCIDKMLYIERDNALRIKCKMLRKLSVKK